MGRIKINDIIADSFSEIFEEDLRTEICNNGILKTVETDKIIIDVRTKIDFIPLIISGIVKVIRCDGKGNDIFLHYLSAKQTSTIAVTYAIEDIKSDIRLKAESNVMYIAIPSKVVISWFLKYSTWLSFYFRLNQQETAYLIERINDIAFENLESRLLKYLEYTSLISNNNTVDKKHYDIARDLKVSREAISRILGKLEKKEIVTLGRNKITLN
ncbi:MAG: Crp/Fnr family transcriptional regulator [Lutibacter sp.]|nr:Crp/Fnr family transcriptional regulator [Lutibacter sp.]